MAFLGFSSELVSRVLLSQYELSCAGSNFVRYEAAVLLSACDKNGFPMSRFGGDSISSITPFQSFDEQFFIFKPNKGANFIAQETLLPSFASGYS
jgi:hypothetical protein